MHNESIDIKYLGSKFEKTDLILIDDYIQRKC